MMRFGDGRWTVRPMGWMDGCVRVYGTAGERCEDGAWLVWCGAAVGFEVWHGFWTPNLWRGREVDVACM